MRLAAVHIIEAPGPATSSLHPLRLRILGELAEPESAAGLARRLGMTRQRLNYHLRQLETQGLVVARGERKRRNCTERLVQAVARSYLISPATLGPLAVDHAPIPDPVSSSYLLSLAAQMLREVAALRERIDRVGERLPTVALRIDLRFPSPEAQHGFAQELSQVISRLAAKYPEEGGPAGRRFRVVVGAYPAPPDREEHPAMTGR